jgi:hypothetical protein
MRLGAIVFLVCGIFAGAAASNHQNTAKTAAEEVVNVMLVLSDLGRKHGVTFTVEEAIAEDHAGGHIREARLKNFAAGEVLTMALNKLSNEVPDFTWQRDSQNGEIIHIIDQRLLDRKNYALDDMITDLKYSGNVSGLVDAIAAKGVSVSPRGQVSSSDLLLTDFGSPVKVDIRNIEVRAALTEFVPLAGRAPILWWAETRLSGSDLTTYVRYCGAPRPFASSSK